MEHHRNTGAARRVGGVVLLAMGLVIWARAEALELPSCPIDYHIAAALDPKTRALTGSEEIRWRNTTDHPLVTLPLHLYLNGFSHQDTTWMIGDSAERLLFGDLLKREPDPWGWMDLKGVEQQIGQAWRPVAAQPIRPDDGNPLDRSLFALTLAAPLAPGETATLRIVFAGRLPVPIARTGGRDDFFLVGQWYPKIGVIEPTGVRHAPAPRSAARQFHGPTEFYADFADYDVRFVVPAGFLVGASGRSSGEPRALGDGRIEAHYQQRAVHDFALVVGSTSAVEDAWVRHQPAGGGPAVDVRFVVTKGTAHQVPRWQRAVASVLDTLGKRVGPYPYDTLTVVVGPYWAQRTEGMEYPTFITGGPGDPLLDLAPLQDSHAGEGVIIHEFGHQYFYGMLASNEQEDAFLDEGFNTYWEWETEDSGYGTDEQVLGRALANRELRSLGLASVAARIREPLGKGPTWLYAQGTWAAQVYTHTAVLMQTAAARFGQPAIDRLFAEYFRRYAFRHPDLEDFFGVAQAIGPPELVAFLREGFAQPRLPDFNVVSATSEPWEVPLGRVVTDDGQTRMVTKTERNKMGDFGLPPEAREADGRVTLEVSDSGWARDGQRQLGTVTRVQLVPTRAAGIGEGNAADRSAAEEGAEFYQSAVRVDGPGWEHLPVTVELRFADGVVVRDRWDGRATWRRYRVWRKARLIEARVDPEGEVVLDVWPQNNALAVKPARGFMMDWGLWMAAVASWVGGLGTWL